MSPSILTRVKYSLIAKQNSSLGSVGVEASANIGVSAGG
jgi:hypothetical protein